MIQVEEKVRILDNLDDVPSEVSRLRGYGRDVGYDIETVGTDPINSRMVALQFKPKGKQATIIDVRHFTSDDLVMLGSMLEPLFDGTVTLVGHNLKFDLSFAMHQMKLASHKVYDTMIAEQVVLGLGVSSANDKGIHFGMADLAQRYGIEVEKESRSWFIDLDKTEAWDQPFPDQQVKYMRQDVSAVHKIKEQQGQAIYDRMLYDVLDLEMRVIPALVGIEVWGVQIDREGWLAVIDRVEARAKELEAVLHLGKEGESSDPKSPDRGFEGLDVHILKVRQEKYLEKWRPFEEWKAARDAFIATRKTEWEAVPKGYNLATPEGTFKNWSEYKKFLLEWYDERHEKVTRPTPLKSGVNLGSWMQVRDGFNDLGIPVKSVSEETLTPYVNKHPLVQAYIDYAQAKKIVGVYGRERGKKERAFIELLDAHNRLRASYQQIGADTERMSSYNPNFQQIPADGLGAELRKNVIAAPGYTLVVADFSNIELRIVAELSGDQFLLDAFASGRDVHAYTAMVMFGLPEEQATKEWTDSHNAVVGGKELVNTTYRKVAKTINYMLLYGAGVKRLAAMLRITEIESKALLDLYYQTFATAIAWLNGQKQRLDEAKRRGERVCYSETRAGWKRWFDIPVHPKYPVEDGKVTVEAMEKYKEDEASWKAEMASIRRQLANTPIQGLSAAITKLAAALWYEHVGYDEDRRLIGIVHDENLLEVRPELAEEAARLLEWCMYEAMKKYLHVVDLGEVHAVITDYWKH